MCDVFVRVTETKIKRKNDLPGGAAEVGEMRSVNRQRIILRGGGRWLFSFLADDWMKKKVAKK